MSKALFLNMPAYGHVNPTLGIVSELVKRGENVTYFCTNEFKSKIEQAGANFKSYNEKTNPLTKKQNINIKPNLKYYLNYASEIIASIDVIIKDILEQIKGIKYDYIVYGSTFAVGKIIAKILKMPSVASFAIFATAKELIEQRRELIDVNELKNHPVNDVYKDVSEQLKIEYDVKLPDNIVELFFNKGDINIAYTSKYFVAHTEYYDDSFKFIGPPIYDRKENIEFPFEKLKGKKVAYISLGTVFNNTDNKLYDIFFKTFANTDFMVVMSAYNLDLSKFNIPDNFIVRSYVPQSKILKYTDVAITHAGMNSTSDLIYNNVPFVAIPIGADQPYIASRAAELKATISLDKDKLTPKILKSSVEKVLYNSNYLKNIKKISNSFKQTGGYPKAVEEIFKLKNLKHILN